jgi:hypothetical protein
VTVGGEGRGGLDRGAPEPQPDDDLDWSWVSEDDGWVPPVVDVNKPSVARMYDYYLGGKDNFAVDREAAEQLPVVVPFAPLLLPV